jgi:hypothetical protein
MITRVGIQIPTSQLQIDFAFALEQIRRAYLQEALSRAVATLDINKIDAELAEFVPGDSLSKLAGHGLRGELMFAVPCILRAGPRLLGYYRLLLGFSQKAFYGAGGLGRFKSIEESGSLNGVLCRALDRRQRGSRGYDDGAPGAPVDRSVLSDVADPRR